MASFVALQSYGLVLMAVPVALIAWWAGRARPVLVASIVAIIATLALGAWGYWWPSGLFATIDTYHDLGLDPDLARAATHEGTALRAQPEVGHPVGAIGAVLSGLHTHQVPVTAAVG